MTAKEHQVLEAAIAALHRTTGLAPRVIPKISRRAAATKDAIVNSTIQLQTAGRNYSFAAEVKTVDRFETPALVRARLKHARKRPLLVAPYITREIAERCRRLHLPFIDTAGNAYLAGPGLMIYVTGQPRPAEMKQDRFRALNPAGLRITFALLCRPELIRTNYRKIAAAAKVALGTVGPVMRDLEARGFLRLKAAAPRNLLDPERMLQEFVTHYPATLRPKLNPRRFQADAERLRKTRVDRLNAYWGGEFAAEKLTQYLKAERFTVYASGSIAGIVAANRMRAERTGIVEVLDVFWDFGAPSGDKAGLVPPVLVYADLLATNDGRNAEAAKLIYEQWIRPAFHRAA